MPGFKQPCRYCEKLVPPGTTVCPFCSKVDPTGPLRCPKCRVPIQKDWKACNSCGVSLAIICPKCGKSTFFSNYCQNCGGQIVITCPNRKCNTVQPPIGDKCIQCGKPLK